MTLTHYTMRELLVPVFVRGQQVYQSPRSNRFRRMRPKSWIASGTSTSACANRTSTSVDLSQPLYVLKQKVDCQVQRAFSRGE